MTNWNHFRNSRTRYETEPERIERERKQNHPAFLKTGYKILTDASPELKWWNPIMATLQMEEAELVSWTIGDQTFRYMTQEEMDQQNTSNKPKEEKAICMVIKVKGFPLDARVWEIRGYWFVSVYYYEVSSTTINSGTKAIRERDLIFNNRAEAMDVRSGSRFDKNEQDID